MPESVNDEIPTGWDLFWLRNLMNAFQDIFSAKSIAHKCQTPEGLWYEGERIEDEYYARL